MNIKDQIKLRRIVGRICTGDLPNKPDGNKIDDMTERYMAYHNWNIDEGLKLICEFFSDKDKS